MAAHSNIGLNYVLENVYRAFRPVATHRTTLTLLEEFTLNAVDLSVARQEEPVHFCLEVGPHKGLLL